MSLLIHESKWRWCTLVLSIFKPCLSWWLSRSIKSESWETFHFTRWFEVSLQVFHIYECYINHGYNEVIVWYLVQNDSNNFFISNSHTKGISNIYADISNHYPHFYLVNNCSFCMGLFLFLLTPFPFQSAETSDKYPRNILSMFQDTRYVI